MISKEKFIELISKHKKWNDRIDQVHDVLGICVFELDFIDYSSILFEYIIDLLFTEEGKDNIFWWIYEKDGNPNMKMWDENDNEIPTETIEDLWEIIKDYRK